MERDSNYGLVDNVPWAGPSKGYALSGKIMLSAIVVLFAVVVFMVGLHIYAHWRLRSRRRHLLRRLSHRRRQRHLRTHIVFYVDNHPDQAAVTSAASGGGLDASVLASLPVFVYASKTHPDVPECAVCLSEFEDGESGRLLPECGHSFHSDCIDMWFHSHSTCPICRSPILLESSQAGQSDLDESVGESASTEPGSSSELCSTCLHEEEGSSSSSSSVAPRRKGMDLVGVKIEVPSRNESPDELFSSSPASQGFKSPGTRLRSFKRMISMTRKACGPGTSCGSLSEVTELDLERGTGELLQDPGRAQTPR